MYCKQVNNTVPFPSANNLFCLSYVFKRSFSFSLSLIKIHQSFGILFILIFFLFYSGSLHHHLPANQSDTPSHFLPCYSNPKICYSTQALGDANGKKTTTKKPTTSQTSSKTKTHTHTKKTGLFLLQQGSTCFEKLLDSV